MLQNSTQWQVEAYEHALKLDAPREQESSSPPPVREKGDITSFSRASRRSLIQKILKLERSRLSAGSFVTLTYHDDWTLEREDLQADLNAFLQALRREYPDAVYLWRLEFQKRGAPHFHLIIWNPHGCGPIPLDELSVWVRTTWTRIAAQDSTAHRTWGTDTARIESWREAMSYVSKYVAANGDEGEVEYAGRRWGAAQSLPTAPTLRFHVSESDGHLLRRILRKFVAKSLGKESPLHEHLKQGKKALVALEPETWQKLMDYLQDHGEGSIRAGPMPRAPNHVPEHAEWIRYTENPAPTNENEIPHTPPLAHV